MFLLANQCVEVIKLTNREFTNYSTNYTVEKNVFLFANRCIEVIKLTTNNALGCFVIFSCKMPSPRAFGLLAGATKSSTRLRKNHKKIYVKYIKLTYSTLTYRIMEMKKKYSLFLIKKYILCSLELPTIHSVSHDFLH